MPLSHWARAHGRLSATSYVSSSISLWDTALNASRDASAHKAAIETLTTLLKEGRAAEMRTELDVNAVPAYALDTPDEQGMTLMHWAIQLRHLDCLKVLLASGASCNLREPKGGATPLILAIKLENLAMTRLLIEHHASLDARDGERLTALDRAARQNQAEAIEMLLEARLTEEEEGVQASAEEDKAQLIAALMTALRNGSTDCVEVILRFLGELVLPADLKDVFADECGHGSADGQANAAANIEATRTAMRALLSAYAKLPPEALARCVASAFKAWPCSCLHGLIQLSALAKQHARKLRTLDTVSSEELRIGADRLQLAVPASLGELNDQQEVNRLLHSPDGALLLPLAVRAECKLLLAQPSVQHFLNAEWLGPLIDEWVHKSPTPHLYLLRGFFLLLLFLPQLLLLPVISFYPPFKKRLERLMWCDLCLEGLFVRGLAFGKEEHRPYLLGVPIIKFTVSEAFDCFFTIWLTFPVVPMTSSFGPREVLGVQLFWASASLMSEIRKIAAGDGSNVGWRALLYEIAAIFSSDTRSAYRSDIFNFVDTTSIISMTAALIMKLAAPETNGPSTYGQVLASLYSVALFLYWLRSLRLIAQLPSIGPLVLMVTKMTRDVAQWATLLLMILSAFVSALHTLYQTPGPNWMAAQEASSPTSATLSQTLDHDCIDFDEDFQSWDRAFFLLLEGTLTNENWLECARLSSHAILGSALMYGCQAMVAVLLFNMLIAMMAKTFDTVWEAQELNYQFLLAQTVLTWRTQPTNPPPFNALRVPYYVFVGASSLISQLRALCCKKHLVEEVADSTISSRSSRLSSHWTTPYGAASEDLLLRAVTRKQTTNGASETRVSVFARTKKATLSSEAAQDDPASGAKSQRGALFSNILFARNGFREKSRRDGGRARKETAPGEDKHTETIPAAPLPPPGEFAAPATADTKDELSSPTSKRSSNKSEAASPTQKEPEAASNMGIMGGLASWRRPNSPPPSPPEVIGGAQPSALKCPKVHAPLAIRSAASTAARPQSGVGAESSDANGTTAGPRRAAKEKHQGLYMRGPFFVSWNHKHSLEQLTVRLTDSILRHENDFLQEGRRKAKIESVEGLVTQHLHEMEGKLIKKMREFAGEHAEQIAELHVTQQQVLTQVGMLLEALDVPDSETNGSSRGSPDLGSRHNSPDVGKQMRGRLKLRTVREAIDDLDNQLAA